MHVPAGSKSPRRPVNASINMVPLIDVMSCLVVFLLVSTMGTRLSGLDFYPEGLARHCGPWDDDEINASVLVTDEEIWVGVSRLNELVRIQKVTNGKVTSETASDGEHDWAALFEILALHKAEPYFDDRIDIELAAENDVPYGDMVTAMDTAIAAGFIDVDLASPHALSARPML